MVEPWVVALASFFCGAFLATAVFILIGCGSFSTCWRRRFGDDEGDIQISASIALERKKHADEMNTLRKEHFVRLATAERRANAAEDKCKTLTRGMSSSGDIVHT